MKNLTIKENELVDDIIHPAICELSDKLAGLISERLNLDKDHEIVRWSNITPDDCHELQKTLVNMFDARHENVILSPYTRRAIT